MTEEVKNTADNAEAVKANKKAESKAKAEVAAAKEEGRKSRVEKIEHPTGDFVIEHL